jgi:hypothetical protein
MTEEANGSEEQTEPREVGNQLMRIVAWIAVAAVVALVVGLCLLVLSLMGVI